MIPPCRFGVCGLTAAVLFLTGSVVQAQGSGISVDPVLARRGKSLFTSTGCTICHTFGKGKTLAGPDLRGVTDRRSVEWLRRLLREPEAMSASDSTVRRELAEANGVKMPNLRLRDADIDALINYLAQETADKR